MKKKSRIKITYRTTLHKKDVALLEVAELTFIIFHSFVYKWFSRELRPDVCLPRQIYRQMYGTEIEKLIGRRLAKLNH